MSRSAYDIPVAGKAGNGWALAGRFPSKDVSAQQNLNIKLNVKGNQGKVLVQLFDKDGGFDLSVPAGRGLSKVYTVSLGQRELSIPLSEFTGLDLTAINGIAVHNGSEYYGTELNRGFSIIIDFSALDFSGGNSQVVSPSVAPILGITAPVQITGAVNTQTLQLEPSAAGVNEKAIDWLKSHRGGTGLVAGHPGHPQIGTWGFTYDQAISAMSFMVSGDRASAEKILDFFAGKAQRGTNGMYYTGYDVNTGKPVEWNLFVGPTAWIGIAMAQYTEFYNDTRYFAPIQRIAQATAAGQKSNGGIPGGMEAGNNRVTWVSTEHNIDAYVLFDYLARKAGDQSYANARDKVTSWLVNEAYSNGRLNRGENDNIVATDAQGWGVSANIPGIDNAKLLEFAEANTKVTVRTGTGVEVTGYAFTNNQDMVTPEWTAEMANAWAPYDKTKRDTILAEMEKLRSADGGLPYATQAGVPTGHGWDTPPASVKSSTAGTAYVYLAQKGLDPLRISIGQTISVQPSAGQAVAAQASVQAVSVTPAVPVFEPSAIGVNEKGLQWLKANRGGTGLVAGHPGHPQIGTWGFTYDQAISAMSFMLSGDRASAEKILDFFAGKAQRGSNGMYYSGYDVNTGKPAEMNLFVGPTAWIGIAMAQYTELYSDTRYLSVTVKMTRSIEENSAGGRSCSGRNRSRRQQSGVGFHGAQS
jgi:hypothetical protein